MYAIRSYYAHGSSNANAFYNAISRITSYNVCYTKLLRIIRTADAVSINGVFLTDDCCDIYNPKVIRSTMGSLFRMNLWTDCNFTNILNTLKEKSVYSYAAVIDSDALSLTECDFSSGAVVVIGNEGNGLPDDVISLCDKKLTIKMQGNINSLNAAMASGIIMWEMLR